jgi:hypothetical protein
LLTSNKENLVGKLPESFDDWRVPWTEADFDSDKAARMVFKLKKGYEDLQGEVEKRDEQIATLTTDLDTAKAAKSGTDEDAQSELKDLRKKVRDFEASEGKSLPADEKKIWQYEAGLEIGLTKAQALRLVGDDLDAVKADAKSFAAELGIEIDDAGGDSGDPSGNAGGNQARPPVQQPAARYKTGSNGADRVNVVSDPVSAASKLPPLFG